MRLAWRRRHKEFAMHKQRVVITGVGVLAANGIGKDAYWKSLVENRSGIGPITLFDARDLPSRIAGEVKDFDPHDYLDPQMKPRRMGRFTQLGLVAAKMALDDAGLKPHGMDNIPNLLVVMGVSTSAMDLVGKRPAPYTAVSAVPHALTSAIGYLFHREPALVTLSDGCASSLDAVAYATRLIQQGQHEIAIAGGGEGAITRYVCESMLACRKCSMRNEEPHKASRPFDLHRDFGVMAEGGGIVILESADHARARGAPVYGEILSYKTCADPTGSREGGGLANAMRQALANAGAQPGDIDHVNAHGPSDIDMDITETDMIKEALGEAAYRIPVTSIKGATGCPMGVGGVLQLIATMLMIRHGMIPPTTNYEVPDSRCDLDYVPRRPRHVQIRKALINTHGFGRGNGAMVVGRAT
jgi:3-oxoacyl-[acyl-carrier-protein] synthase II